MDIRSLPHAFPKKILGVLCFVKNFIILTTCKFLWSPIWSIVERYHASKYSPIMVGCCSWRNVIDRIGLVLVAFNSAPFITLHFLAQPSWTLSSHTFMEVLVRCFRWIHRSFVVYRNTCINFFEVAFNFDVFWMNCDPSWTCISNLYHPRFLQALEHTKFGWDLEIYKKGQDQFVRALIQTPNFCVLHNNALTTIVLTLRLSTRTLLSLNIYSIPIASKFYVNCMVFLNFGGAFKFHMSLLECWYLIIQ